MASGTFLTEQGKFFIESGFPGRCVRCGQKKSFLVFRQDRSRTAKLLQFCVMCIREMYRHVIFPEGLAQALDKIEITEKMEALGEDEKRGS